MLFKFLRCRILALRCRHFFVGGCVVFTCLTGSPINAAPGQLDSTFGSGGRVLVDSPDSVGQIRATAIQPDGKIVAAGYCLVAQLSQFCLARFLPSGARDSAFGINGLITTATGGAPTAVLSVAIQPDSKLVAAGMCFGRGGGLCVARYLNDGTLDTQFGNDGIAESQSNGIHSETLGAVKVLPDHGIVVAGSCAAVSGASSTSEICLAKFSENGTPDASFGTNGVAGLGLALPSSAHAIAVRRDGKLVVAGVCAGALANEFCVSMFNRDGSRDVQFGNQGVRLTTVGNGLQFASAVELLDDDRIIVQGSCSVDSVFRFCLVRYLENGSLDETFGVGGTVTTLIGAGAVGYGLAVQDDGKLLVAGNCPSAMGNDFCVVRYLRNGTSDNQFGASGRTVVPVGQGNDWGKAVVTDRNGAVVVGGYCDLSSRQQFCLIRLTGGPYPSQNCGLNVDANLVTGPTTDAALVTRYLLGLRGDALTNGALGQNPTRTGQALETYLASLDLDADGDGQSLATTDGLLLLRAMLGLTGDALTQGATNAAHPNVRNAQQILSWIESTHGVACLL